MSLKIRFSIQALDRRIQLHAVVLETGVSCSSFQLRYIERIEAHVSVVKGFLRGRPKRPIVFGPFSLPAAWSVQFASALSLATQTRSLWPGMEFSMPCDGHQRGHRLASGSLPSFIIFGSTLALVLPPGIVRAPGRGRRRWSGLPSRHRFRSRTACRRETPR